MTSTRETLDCGPLAAAERFDAWVDAVNRSFVPLTADLDDRAAIASFNGALVSQSLGQLSLSTVRGRAVRVQRTRAQIAQSNPEYIKLGLQLRGQCMIAQDGRGTQLGPGDFTLYDTTRPYTLVFDDTFRMFVVMFPAQALGVDRDQIGKVTASRFSGREGVGAILSRTLAAMSEQLDLDALTPEVQLSDAVFQLLDATFEARGELTRTDDSARRDTLRRQVKSYIATHLGNHELSVQSIADAHHISVRYLQKLFEERDETVSGWIRHRRLEQCRRDLVRPGGVGDPIGSIGFKWGFTDGASFARAFRQEFGRTPSEYRAESSTSGDTVGGISGRVLSDM